ncbi:acylamino-acid-releasing enzyme-like [Dorcoceras hygrometricum]|uniref:Acylamino-acid-releasing enzyme-like n=1 Tax=Dorcoceras hygrometricum TaxID=472368 RepID=A0A2Z7CD38_9LAMI|nr:acylamino-acid-releasing enzyme-like [Dorcoceras hygrometricum]
MNENQCLAEIISPWTKSSASLQKLHGAMKLSGNKIGLGYESDESNIAETSTHPKLDRPKLQTMNFVKFSLGQSDESQTAAKPQNCQGRYCGVGYTALEKPRETWLTNQIEQIRGNPKSGGRKPKQLSHAFTRERQY